MAFRDRFIKLGADLDCVNLCLNFNLVWANNKRRRTKVIANYGGSFRLNKFDSNGMTRRGISQ